MHKFYIMHQRQCHHLSQPEREDKEDRLSQRKASVSARGHASAQPKQLLSTGVRELIKKGCDILILGVLPNAEKQSPKY